MTDTDLHKLTQLLYRASELGIKVLYEEGEITVRVPKGLQIENGLLRELKDRKSDLIHHFSGRQKAEESLLHSRALRPFDRRAEGTIPLSFAQEQLWFIDAM